MKAKVEKLINSLSKDLNTAFYPVRTINGTAAEIRSIELPEGGHFEGVAGYVGGERGNAVCLYSLTKFDKTGAEVYRWLP